MHVAFLYNRSTEDPAHGAEDELPARSPVVAALKRLGHSVTPIACTLDLASVRRRLVRAIPDVVFNRVESLGGSDAMMAAITLLLDTMRLPYTGNSTAALAATASKISVKEWLARAGLPTPRWFCTGDKDVPAHLYLQSEIRDQRYILKSVYEHASFEMDDDSVVGPMSQDGVVELLQVREATTGRPYFAEQFIDGREFNLSLIGDAPEVLPSAEIDFSTFPAGKPHIVGHAAKWKVGSHEFHHTPRRFDFSASDGQLLRRLKELAVYCWRLFELCGYARVDFRCDTAGQPWILEINTNPCIAPDAGFAAALNQAGIGYDDGIKCILDDALGRCPLANQPARCPHMVRI